MVDTIKELLGSKRFIVITLTLLVCASFVIAGRMPVDRFMTTLETLGGLLATLYGVENAVLAARPPAPPPAPPRIGSGAPAVDGTS
jgi:hypothetical protein